MSRRKVEYRTYSKANYNRFLSENKLTEQDLSYAKFCKNLEVCNWMFIEYALRTGFKVQLPYGFGHLAVKKKKLKRLKEFNGKTYMNLRVDWHETKKIGKKVYHTNEHSDGYNFRWKWFHKDARFILSELYNFIPGRYSSRAINKYVKKPNSVYKEIYGEWQ